MQASLVERDHNTVEETDYNETAVEGSILLDLADADLAHPGNTDAFLTVDVSAGSLATAAVARDVAVASAAKRFIDVVLSAVALVVLSPAMLVTAVVILATSSGPVLFRQTRVGREGQLFQVLKFRSMVTDAEAQLGNLQSANAQDGPLFKMQDDPRVTGFGRLIRRLSIDEIPQFFNVLRGEMSLVGPRPALPAEMAQWPEELHDRLVVRPGITGLWQVSGRSDASFAEYTKLDLEYVNNWSLLTDLKILARTLPAVFKAAGAY